MLGVGRLGVEYTGSMVWDFWEKLEGAGADVLEVTEPGKLDRRRRGKNDEFDAQSAAHAAFAQSRTVTPRSREGVVPPL